MPAQLRGHRIAILADDGVDSDELRELLCTFTEHGADVKLISVYPAQVLSIDSCGSVTRFSTDQCIHEAAVANHCALVVPSGRGPHEQLKHHGYVTSLARRTVSVGKVLATGHRAAGLLIPAGVARKRRVTSAPHLRAELLLAGACWADVAVMQDRGVVTARRPTATLLATAVLDEVSAPNLALTRLKNATCKLADSGVVQ